MAHTAVVTGALGFVATELVKQLLNKGYSVRATCRSMADADRIETLLALGRALPGALTLHEADLLTEGSFDEAVKVRRRQRLGGHADQARTPHPHAHTSPTTVTRHQHRHQHHHQPTTNPPPPRRARTTCSTWRPPSRSKWQTRSETSCARRCR